MSIMVLYQLWLDRKEAREEIMIADPREIARRSIFLLEEWWAMK
jgi:hypothetical protein